MQPKVLTLTQPEDPHAVAVALALERKGITNYLWYTSDFPRNARETLHFEATSRDVRSSALPQDLTEVATIWNRRPAYVLDEEALHPADREFVDLNCRLFRKSLFDLLEPGAFWVNPHEAVRRDTKLLQLARAQEVGFSIPETLASNDPEEIRTFLQSQGGVLAYKPLSARPWRDQDTHWMPYTAFVTEEKLVEDRLLQAAPGIYQAVVPKQFEIRATVMGQSVLAAKILSQETEHGRQDWRKAYAELRMEAIQLPPRIEQRCVALLRCMGYVFGCFDFVVTPTGEHVFLEVNQMGQFLFLENYTELPLLDAFTDFLCSGSPNFRWEQKGTGLRYQDLQPAVELYLEEVRQDHVKVPDQVWDEDPGQPT